MPKKITAIYVNARIKYFICIYTYKPKNLPAFMHISQKKKKNFSAFTYIYTHSEKILLRLFLTFF